MCIFRSILVYLYFGIYRIIQIYTHHHPSHVYCPLFLASPSLEATVPRASNGRTLPFLMASESFRRMSSIDLCGFSQEELGKGVASPPIEKLDIYIYIHGNIIYIYIHGNIIYIYIYGNICLVHHQLNTSKSWGHM